MDSDLKIKEQVQENRRLIEENNKILKKISRNLAISTWIKIAYWVVILGVAFGSYYLIQPYLDAITGTYNDVRDGVNSAQQFNEKAKDAGSIEGILDTFGDLLN